MRQPLPMPDYSPSTLDAALDALESRHLARNPASLARHREACAVMPGGNTRSNLFYRPFPITIATGSGSSLTDIDGNSYCDFLAEYTAGVYGHSPAAIGRSLRSAFDDGINLAGNNVVEVELAGLLCRRFPSMALVRFTNSGTEANLMALSAALVHTGRRLVVAMEGGYHGGVLGFGKRPAPGNVPYEVAVLPYNDLAASQNLFAGRGDEVAAVLVEPMLGASGCIPGDPSFLHGLRELTRASGSILIVDEVMTSRLAGGGLQQSLNLTPDLTTLGKYIGGGLPLGAFGGRRDIMTRFDPAQTGAILHSGTFNNNILSMAAGLTGLGELFTEDAADRLARLGERLRGELNALCRDHDVPLQFTGIGSVMNVHFTSAPVRSVDDLADVDPRHRQLFFLHMLASGIYIAPRGLIVLSLATTDADIAALIDAIQAFLAAYGALLRDPR